VGGWSRADTGITAVDWVEVCGGDGDVAWAVSGDEAWEGCAEFGGEVVRRRRGRPRKGGRSGDLVVRPDKPAAIAATMPHRRALGEKAVDQLAESELGRLALRGEPVLATAGATMRGIGGGTSRAFALPEPL